MMQSRTFETNDGRIKQDFRGTETLLCDFKDLIVGERVCCGTTFGLFAGAEPGAFFFAWVDGEIAYFFFDLADYFFLGAGAEDVSRFSKQRL